MHVIWKTNPRSHWIFVKNFITNALYVIDNVRGSFAKRWSSVTNCNEIETTYPILAVLIMALGGALAALAMGQEGCPGPRGCVFSGPGQDLWLRPLWDCRARPAMWPWGRPWPVLRGKGPNTRARILYQLATWGDTHSSWGCWEEKPISTATSGPEVCPGVETGRPDVVALGPSNGVVVPWSALAGVPQPLGRPGCVRVRAAGA